MPESSVGIGAHFGSNTLQNLLDAHVAVPVLHGRNLLVDDLARLGIDGRHVDLGHESDFGGHRGVLFGAVDSQLVKAAVVVGL